MDDRKWPDSGLAKGRSTERRNQHPGVSPSSIGRAALPGLALAFQALSTSASRAGVSPVFGLAWRASGCCLNQASVSTDVVASGRKVSPA